MPGQDEVVLITADQEVPASDYMGMQEAPQQTADADIAEALGIVEAYTGLLVTKVNDTTINVAPGRYYKSTVAGLTPRYRNADAKQISLLENVAPVGNLRIVSICVLGQAINDAADLRRFLTDATPGTEQYEPRTVSTRVRRVVSLQIVQGPAGTAPVNPIIPAGYLEIARVTMSNLGIVGNPEMVTDKQLRSLSLTQVQVDALQDENEAQGADLASLRADLAVLARKVEAKPEPAEFLALSRNVAHINERLDIPDTKISAGTDNFESESESETGAAGYDAAIDGSALRFAREASINQSLALLNPVDPKMTIWGNEVVLPKFSEVAWLQTIKKTATVKPLDYTQNPGWNLRRNPPGRLFNYYGFGQTLREIERSINDSKSVRLFDPEANAFETVDLSAQKWTLRASFFDKSFAILRIVDEYPDDPPRKVLTAVAGSAVAFSFVSPGERWLTSIDLAVTDKGAASPIHVAICRTKPDGTPDLDRCLQVTQIAHADIKVSPTMSRATFPHPVAMKRGAKHSLVFITGGAHVFGTSADNRQFAGTLFAAIDGTSFTAIPGVDLTCRLNSAKFEQVRTVVELTSLVLGGGIHNIDMIYRGVEIGNSGLVLQGQVGGVWRNLDHTDLTALNGAPNTILLRAVFEGNEWQQCSLHLGASRLIGWRQKQDFYHVSKQRAPATESEDIVVTLRLLDFDAAKHDCDVTLLPGPAYDTPVAADSTTVLATPNPRIKRLVAKFTPDAPGLDDFKIAIDGHTDVQNDVYAVLRRSDVEL